MQRCTLIATGGDLSFSVAGQGQPATADAPADLGQSLLNLLNNATDASRGRFGYSTGLDAQMDQADHSRTMAAGVPLAA